MKLKFKSCTMILSYLANKKISMAYYPFENLGDKEFENLVTTICRKILGAGTSAFADGKDGGRDARFSGTADSYPSTKSPWKGKFIIQAKHTSNPIAKCSDSEFSTILKEELPKVVKLKNQKELDNYLLFTNRKFSANSGIRIENEFSQKSNIQNFKIIGKKDIEGFLDDYPRIGKHFGLNKLLLPLTFSEKELARLINQFYLSQTEEEKRKSSSPKYIYPKIGVKNKLNSLSDDYYEYAMGPYLKDIDKIDSFLKNLASPEVLVYYNNLAGNLQTKIIANREDFTSFDKVLEFYADRINQFANEDSITNNIRLVKALLYYMYFNCDIGKKE